MSEEEGTDVQVTEQSAQQSKEPVTTQAARNGRSGSQVPPPKTGVEKRGI